MIVIFTMQFINTSKALYCIWIILSFSCEGAYPVLFPAKTIEIYGLKIGPNVYTIVFFGLCLANLT